MLTIPIVCLTSPKENLTVIINFNIKHCNGNRNKVRCTQSQHNDNMESGAEERILIFYPSAAVQSCDIVRSGQNNIHLKILWYGWRLVIDQIECWVFMYFALILVNFRSIQEGLSFNNRVLGYPWIHIYSMILDIRLHFFGYVISWTRNIQNVINVRMRDIGLISNVTCLKIYTMLIWYKTFQERYFWKILFIWIEKWFISLMIV
jgi:hypothetical protein